MLTIRIVSFGADRDRFSRLGESVWSITRGHTDGLVSRRIIRKPYRPRAVADRYNGMVDTAKYKDG